MNRQAAVGELNARINGGGSGSEEWSRLTESNRSLNPTALSLAFIKVGWFVSGCMVASGGGLSLALGASRSEYA